MLQAPEIEPDWREEPRASLYIRVPVSAYERMKATAERDGMDFNAWVLRSLEWSAV